MFAQANFFVGVLITPHMQAKIFFSFELEERTQTRSEQEKGGTRKGFIWGCFGSRSCMSFLEVF
jgi:hypothetical protein